MTPARTLTLALICARAFTLDLNTKEHNCTISDEDNRICNETRYGDDENLRVPIDGVKLRSSFSKERNDLDVMFIGDDQNVLVSNNYENNNNLTNINQTSDYNWTNNQGRYIYDQNLRKQIENILGSNDDLQAHYLAVSELNGKGNVKKAFDETLFADIPGEDIIYELSDEQYYAMPRLFELDDYPSCRGARDVYCLGSFELATTGENTLFSVMQIRQIAAVCGDKVSLNTNKRFSANWVDNFNHTRLHRGVCLTHGCPPPSPDVDGLKGWLESCVNASIVSAYNLTARLYHLEYCTTGREAAPPLNTSESAFAALVVLLLVLTVVSTTLDVIMSDDIKKDYGWALSWSLISSWRSLTAPAQASRSTNLLFFDGLRVFCMLSVIVEHVCWLGTQAYVSDTRYVELTRRASDAMLLANSTVMVQIFFLMASFLLTHKLLQEQQESSIVTFFKMMFNRIIRISPSYFIVLWFASSWWERVGDGPQWSLVVTEAAVCRRKWWEQLLYISNLVNTDDKCLIQTWYLAADMQLYALALALTLWLRRSRRALATLGVIAVALVLGNLVLAYVLKLVPTVVVHNPELIRAAYKGEPSFDWMYTSPHSNALGALAGVLLAHLHHAGLATECNLLGKKWFRLLSVWAVPATLVVVAIWPHLLGTGVPSRLNAAVSAALERPVFITLVTIALFGAMSGVDSPWARWMSCGTVAARLSFGALLLHMLLIKSFLATRLAPVHLDRLSVYIEWFGFSILSYLAAIPLALLVEFPAQRLHKEITLLLQNKYNQISQTKIDGKLKSN